eukprot:INCI7958.1.p1 GENE.INCI7958.1~~INCI7958.1.p1  ORF type:complete len:387 (-),score=64.69 INCI7958.1:262-1326(-)
MSAFAFLLLVLVIFKAVPRSVSDSPTSTSTNFPTSISNNTNNTSVRAVQWDPPQLSRYWWEPAISLFAESTTPPCEGVVTKLEMIGKFGRLNNALIEFVHMLEVVIIGERSKKRVYELAEAYKELVGFKHFDWRSATSSWVCVAEPDNATFKNLETETVNAKDIYYMVQRQEGTMFRATVLSQLLLRPSLEIRRKVEEFEAKYFPHGFNALHLRLLENSCNRRVEREWKAGNARPPTLEGGSKANADDICHMSSRLIHTWAKKAGTAHLPFFLSSDGQSPADAERIAKEFGAVQYSGHDAVFVDMLLLMRSTTFIGNIASTLSANVALVREHSAPPGFATFVATDDCECSPDLV